MNLLTLVKEINLLLESVYLYLISVPCACHLFFSLFRRDLISSKCLGGNTYVSVRFCAESVERRWRSDFFFFDLLTASNTKGWFLLNSNIGENVSNKTHVCFQDGTQILSM